MVSGAEKNREIIPLTWKNSWKAAPELRGFWLENEGENEATVLEFFSEDRPHGIHGFLSRDEPRNYPFGPEKNVGKWPVKFGCFDMDGWKNRFSLF